MHVIKGSSLKDLGNNPRKRKQEKGWIVIPGENSSHTQGQHLPKLLSKQDS